MAGISNQSDIISAITKRVNNPGPHMSDRVVDVSVINLDLSTPELRGLVGLEPEIVARDIHAAAL